jgi:hypothetical protein
MNQYCTCPPRCCDENDDECQRTMGNHGAVINPAEEIMLIYGGLTARDRKIGPNNETELFNDCE